MSAPAATIASTPKSDAIARTNVPVYCAAIGYVVLVASTIHRHEPWADEAQAWLLARDAPISVLWTHLLHYEGSPGLWQTLLKVLIHLGLPYSAYNFVSAALAFAAVWILLRYSPFPLAIRLLLPFTYYLAYQYSVIARSYALMAPLLLATAILYRRATQRPLLFHTLLCLIAGISVHGVVVSCCIWVTAYGPALLAWRDFPSSRSRPFAAAASGYGVAMLFFVLCAWPARDVAFAQMRGSVANLRFLSYIGKLTIAEPLTGYWITSLAVIALCWQVLWRGGGWLVLLLANVILWIFGTVVYTALWHFGILFLVWVFALWISIQKTPLTRSAQLSIFVVIAFQAYWTAQAVRYDWEAPYSGSLAAARYLHRDAALAGNLYAIGYPTLAIQPYFPSNVFSDFHDHLPLAYWDWSKKNPARDASTLFAARLPDHVVVGYTSMEERDHWARLLDVLGYQRIRRFEGATFWRTHVFEAQSYDLYDRSPGGTARLRSVLNMGEASTENQIRTGIYAAEMNAWRWTAQNFSVILKPPPGAGNKGAVLEMHIYLSPGQIERLGSLTLSGDVNNYPLTPRTFTSAGAYTYTQAIPARVLAGDFGVTNFRLDKSAEGVGTDRRELGIIVSAISLR